MSTVAKQHSRSDRIREYASAREAALLPVAAMAVLVQAREARPWEPADPPEVVFAQTNVDERALPAAIWVALRRDDVAGAVEAMAAASETPFLIESREEMGEGYRLQTVEETRPLPEVELLLEQLATMLDIPRDVLGILSEWGPEDPRTEREISDLFDRRLGPVDSTAAQLARHAAPSGDGLTMTVGDAAAVLRLSEEQTTALATLVRRVHVTITA